MATSQLSWVGSGVIATGVVGVWLGLRAPIQSMVASSRSQFSALSGGLRPVFAPCRDGINPGVVEEIRHAAGRGSGTRFPAKARWAATDRTGGD